MRSRGRSSLPIAQHATLAGLIALCMLSVPVIASAVAGDFIDFFVTAGSGGLDEATYTTFGPDGNFYVASLRSHEVLRYNGTTGAFIDVFVSGVTNPFGLAFRPDGNLYVLRGTSGDVLRYNGTTGAFIDIFASTGSISPRGMVFGPAGDVYVSGGGTHDVRRFDGTTGAFLGIFASGGGLNGPRGLAFGPDGNLYVSSAVNDQVLRYNGTTGAFIDVFVTAGSGGLDFPEGLEFHIDGNLYVASNTGDEVLRYDAKTGAFIDVFASGNSMNAPTGLLFGPAGSLYVANQLAPYSVLRFEAQTLVDIDIEPRSDKNKVRMRGISVAILSDLGEGFLPVEHVDPNTLTFGIFGDEMSLHRCWAGRRGHRDYNGDGEPDLLCTFFTLVTGLNPIDHSPGDMVDLILNGETFGGETFSGIDTVMIGRLR